MKIAGLDKINIPIISKREKILAVILLVMALFALYYYLVFEPQLIEVNKLQLEIEEKQQVLETRLSQGWNDIPALMSDSQDIKSRIDDIHHKVPVTVDEPGLLVSFYHTAKESNLIADTIKFDELEEVADSNYSFISVSLEVSGNNADIYHFIEGVEHYPRFNRVSAVEFEPQSADKSICSITVDFYVLHEVELDPSNYSFMNGDYGRLKPYQIFNIYQSNVKETAANIPGDEQLQPTPPPPLRDYLPEPESESEPKPQPQPKEYLPQPEQSPTWLPIPTK